MRFCEALEIPKGVTAVIGSGGKTTLLHTLADELTGRIILCTTTRMFPSDTYKTLYDPDAETVRRDWARVLCIGSPGENGKIGPCASLPLRALAALADYVLVEADGSKGLPLKAHAPWEPVIPPEAKQVICVAGLTGLGQPISTATHRPELYARLAGVSTETAVTPEIAARVLNGESAGWRYFLNQADTPALLERGRTLAALLRGPTAVGSLKKGEIQCLS